MPIIPIFGRGVKGRSSSVTSQSRINLYQEPGEDKSQLTLYSRPGLSPEQFTNNSGVSGGPMRGCLAVERVINVGTASQQVISVVYGATQDMHVTSLNNSSRFLGGAEVGYIPNNNYLCLADNGIDVMGVDGRNVSIALGSPAITTLQLISSVPANFPSGATSICSVASRFIVNDPSHNGRFYWSGVLDYTSWAALDYATAEGISDPLVAVYAWRGELILWGTRSIEFWSATGDNDVFRRTSGAAVPWGLADQRTIQDVNGRLLFVARSSGGDLQVLALNGYQGEPVSTPDVEKDINDRASGPLVALTVRKAGHVFYVLNLTDKTWAYDATTGVWDEWQTDGGRFAGQFLFNAYSRTSVTDYRYFRTWGMDDDAYTDAGSNLVREVATRHVFHDLDRLSVSEFMLDVETGVGLTSGQGSDPQVMLQVSRDGGHTFGDEMWETLGAIGEYLKTVAWKRLGRARDFVFRLRVSDPVKVVLLGGSVRIDK